MRRREKGIIVEDLTFNITEQETNDQRSKKGRNSGMCKPDKEGIFDRGR